MMFHENSPFRDRWFPSGTVRLTARGFALISFDIWVKCKNSETWNLRPFEKLPYYIYYINYWQSQWDRRLRSNWVGMKAVTKYSNTKTSIHGLYMVFRSRSIKTVEKIWYFDVFWTYFEKLSRHKKTSQSINATRRHGHRVPVHAGPMRWSSTPVYPSELIKT
jgi:hypothetical protein